MYMTRFALFPVPQETTYYIYQVQNTGWKRWENGGFTMVHILERSRQNILNIEKGFQHFGTAQSLEFGCLFPFEIGRSK